jgi:hypothetical protein
MKPNDNNGNLPTSQRLFEFSLLADGAGAHAALVIRSKALHPTSNRNLA